MHNCVLSTVSTWLNRFLPCRIFHSALSYPPKLSTAPKTSTCAVANPKNTYVFIDGVLRYLKLIQKKTIGNRKRECGWGCAQGINSTWENLQFEKHKSVRWAERTSSWFVLFDLQIFSGQAQHHAQSLFLFPIVFGIQFDSFFRWEEGQCSRKFDRLFQCFDPLSRHLTKAKGRMRTVSKSATFLATESVNPAPFKRGETKVERFGKESAKLFANTKVQIFGKEKWKTHLQFQRD